MAGLVVYLMAGLAYNVRQKGMEMGPEALPHASMWMSLASGMAALLVCRSRLCLSLPLLVTLLTPCAPHAVRARWRVHLTCLRRWAHAGGYQGGGRAGNGHVFGLQLGQLGPRRIPKLLILSSCLPLQGVHVCAP